MVREGRWRGVQVGAFLWRAMSEGSAMMRDSTPTTAPLRRHVPPETAPGGGAANSGSDHARRFSRGERHEVDPPGRRRPDVPGTAVRAVNGDVAARPLPFARSSEMSRGHRKGTSFRMESYGDSNRGRAWPRFLPAGRRGGGDTTAHRNYNRPELMRASIGGLPPPMI